MPHYLVILAPTPGPVPVEIRLRAALKRLLRDHGLRAVDVREEAEIAPPREPQAAPSTVEKQRENNQPRTGGPPPDPQAVEWFFATAGGGFCLILRLSTLFLRRVGGTFLPDSQAGG